MITNDSTATCGGTLPRRVISYSHESSSRPPRRSTGYQFMKAVTAHTREPRGQYSKKAVGKVHGRRLYGAQDKTDSCLSASSLTQQPRWRLAADRSNCRGVTSTRQELPVLACTCTSCIFSLECKQNSPAATWANRTRSRVYWSLTSWPEVEPWPVM